MWKPFSNYVVAPMDTTDDLTRAIEQEFDTVAEVIQGAPDIVSIVCGGVKGEGEMVPLYATSKKAAIRSAYDGFKEYREGHSGGTLIWRCKPEVRELDAYSFLDGKSHRYEFPLFDGDRTVTVDADFAFLHTLFLARMRLAIRD